MIPFERSQQDATSGGQGARGSADAGTAAPLRLSPALEWIVLGLAVIYVIVALIPCITIPPGRDHGTYLTVGNSILHGKVLYRDIWDNKPPAIFFVYAAVAGAFGRVFWSIAVMDIFLATLGCILLYRFLRPTLGVLGGCVTVVFYAAWHCRFRYYWVAQPEMFQGVCAMGICLLLRWREDRWRLRYASAGILMAFGFLLKYTFIVAIPFLVVLPLLDMEKLGGVAPRIALRCSWREALTRAGVALGACAVAVAAAVGALIAQGSGPAMFESQFVVLPRYAAQAVQYEPHYIYMAMLRMGGVLPPFVLGTVAVALLLAYLRRDLPRCVPVLLPAFGMLGTALVQVRFHDYYFTGCYAFLAAFWGYLAVAGLELMQNALRILQRRGLRLAVALVWVAVINLCLLPLPEEYVRQLLRYHQLLLWVRSPVNSYAHYPGALDVEFLGGQIDVLQFLRENARPQDKVFLWGSNSLLYFLSGHEPPTRFPLNLGLISRWSPPEWLPVVAAQVRQAAPTYIIVTRGDQLRAITYSNLDSEQYLRTFPALRDYIAQNYVSVRHLKDFEIYQRRTTAGTLATGAAAQSN